jgi:hypothetical protein
MLTHVCKATFTDTGVGSVEYFTKCSSFPAIPSASLSAKWLTCGSDAEANTGATGSPNALGGEARTCTDASAITFGNGFGSFLCEGQTPGNRFNLTSACHSAVDVNFFETYLDVPAGTVVDATHPFVMNITGDDGGRVTIFNSDHPNGCVITPAPSQQGGSFFTYDPRPTDDLSSCLKAGEANRLVITQIDTCCYGNTIQSAYPVFNGLQMTEAQFQPIDCVFSGPTVGPCNAACGAAGTQTVTYTITTPANALGVQCPQDTTQACTGSPCTTTTTTTLAPTTTTTTLAPTTTTTLAPATATTLAPTTTTTTLAPTTTTLAPTTTTTTTLAPTTTTTLAPSTTTTTSQASPTTNASGVPAEDNGPANLVLIKDDCVTTVIPGASYTYKFTVNNTGNSAADAVTLTDTWPSGLLEITSLPGSCVSVANNITCALGSIAGRGSVTTSIGYRVLSSVAPGTFVSNCARVASASVAIQATNEGCDLNQVVLGCLPYDTVCGVTADCCSGLLCLRHASSCNGTFSTSFLCARRGGSSINV